MSQRRFSRMLALVGSAAFFTGGGCRPPDRLTHDHYSLVQPQLSTQDQVAALLGEPTNQLGEQWVYERPRRHLYVFIDFDASGRVIRKQWIDAPGGVWEDTLERPGSESSHGGSSSHRETHGH